MSRLILRIQIFFFAQYSPFLPYLLTLEKIKPEIYKNCSNTGESHSKTTTQTGLQTTSSFAKVAIARVVRDFGP